MLGQVAHAQLLMYVQYSMIISILSELITVAEFSFGVDTVDAQEFEFHSSVPTVVCSECYIYTMETKATHMTAECPLWRKYHPYISHNYYAYSYILKSSARASV